MNKLQIISDKNRKSLNIKNILLKKLVLIILKKNLIIVIGGDGFMLQTLKKIKIQINFSMGLTPVTMAFS